MSNPYQFKAGGVEKCTDEELLVLMIAASGGIAPGIKAYEVFAKLDEKGHSAASFRHTFSALVVKAKELQAKKPEVELLNAAATPKKAVGVGRKRKADDAGEEADGGEDEASASGGGKKAKTAGKARAAGKKGGKKVVMDEEVAGCRGGCYTKKGDRGAMQK